MSARCTLLQAVPAALLALTLCALAASASPDLKVQATDISGLTWNCQTARVSGTVGATIKNVGDTATQAVLRVSFFEDENHDYVHL